MTARYAVYAAPAADSALQRAAEDWYARHAAITVSARHYGFHATLKPPFRLAGGRTVEELEATVAALAASLSPARCRLRVGLIGGFLALVPEAGEEAIAAIAARCVADLDGFRAPAPPEELARRRAAGLSTRQEALLRQWGYPYVMEEFRLHFTLTDRLEPERDDIAAAAQAHFADCVRAPFVLDQLCLFAQISETTDFLVRSRHPLHR